MASEFRLNDFGSTIVAEVTEDGSALDLSTATEITFTFVKPSGTRLERTGTVIGDGSTGNVRYVFEQNELNEAGQWSYDVNVAFGASGAYTSSPAQFSVVQTL